MRTCTGSQETATSSRAAPARQPRQRSGRDGHCRGASRLPVRTKAHFDPSNSAAGTWIRKQQAPAGVLGGFQTTSLTPVGRVLCTSRGCRPVSNLEFSQLLQEPHMLANKAAMQRYESALLDAGEDPNSRSHSNYPLLFAHYVAASHPKEKLVELIYEEALRTSPDDPAVLCSYADYLCYQVGDASRASQLYQRAVEADTGPNATALATYANFLFRNPCQDQETEESWDLDAVQSYLAANSPSQ